jgi:hypothetical protein
MQAKKEPGQSLVQPPLPSPSLPTPRPLSASQLVSPPLISLPRAETFRHLERYIEFIEAKLDQLSVSIPGVCSVQNDESLFTGYCFTMTSAEIANFPDIIFTLDTAGNVSLPSSTYLLPQEGSDSTIYYCLVVFSGKIDHPHIIDLI